VTELRPKDTPENPYYYTFKVQCTSCRETHPNWVSFSRFVSTPFPRPCPSRSTCGYSLYLCYCIREYDYH